MGCNIWYSEVGPGRAEAPPSPLLAVQHVTPHPSTASDWYNHCMMVVALRFNVAIKLKGLKR